MFMFPLASLLLLLVIVTRVHPSDDIDDMTCKIGSVGTCSIRRNCGLPKLTADQLECLRSKANADKIRELNITEPTVIEDFKFVQLTSEQENQLEECYGGSLFQPLEAGPSRRKREAVPLACCQGQNPFVLLTHARDTQQRMVEIVQMQTHGQSFENTGRGVCMDRDVCDGLGGNGTICDTQPLDVTAVVIIVDPDAPGFTTTTITVNTCRTFAS